jgi:hypothetical protein
MAAINKSKARIALGIVLVWAALAIAISIAGTVPPSPPEWLRAWTLLLAPVISLAVGLTALWRIPDLLRDLTNRLAPLAQSGSGKATEPSV